MFGFIRWKKIEGVIARKDELLIARFHIIAKLQADNARLLAENARLKAQLAHPMKDRPRFKGRFVKVDATADGGTAINGANQ